MNIELWAWGMVWLHMYGNARVDGPGISCSKRRHASLPTRLPQGARPTSQSEGRSPLLLLLMERGKLQQAQQAQQAGEAGSEAAADADNEAAAGDPATQQSQIEAAFLQHWQMQDTARALHPDQRGDHTALLRDWLLHQRARILDPLLANEAGRRELGQTAVNERSTHLLQLLLDQPGFSAAGERTLGGAASGAGKTDRPACCPCAPCCCAAWSAVVQLALRPKGPASHMRAVLAPPVTSLARLAGLYLHRLLVPRDRTQGAPLDLVAALVDRGASVEVREPEWKAPLLHKASACCPAALRRTAPAVGLQAGSRACNWCSCICRRPAEGGMGLHVAT